MRSFEFKKNSRDVPQVKKLLCNYANLPGVVILAAAGDVVGHSVKLDRKACLLHVKLAKSGHKNRFLDPTAV